MKPDRFEKVMKDAAGLLNTPTQMLMDVGFIGDGEVKQGAPVRTGTYRRSITSRVEGNAVYIGSALVYAPPLEYGTEHMAAQAPIQSGINRAIPRIETKIAEFGGKLFDKVANG
jgi:hypothetical protein